MSPSRPPSPSPSSSHREVARDFAESPLVGVVRTDSADEAERQARLFLAGGIRLVEITFTVPGATELVRRLLAERDEAGSQDRRPAFRVGMGTATTGERAARAVEAGSEFIISPNVSREVAETVLAADRFLLLGAATPTEIVAAHQLGAHLVKVYPLPALGGPDYLRVVRGPLGDIPMLAAGGFGPEEIPAYRDAGASAFGIGPQLLAGRDEDTVRRVAGAVALARPEAAVGNAA